MLKTADIKLVGRHNVENYMAAIGALDGLVSRENVGEIARTFGGVEHRLEFVRTLDGVNYYNSSIDTSPTRTAAALSALDRKPIIICGGYDKHIPIEPLIGPLVEQARYVVATGDTGMQVLDAIVKTDFSRKNIAYIGEFDKAIRFAADMAKEGDTVLLSPAAASFDAFPNFEKRGDRFCELIKAL